MFGNEADLPDPGGGSYTKNFQRIIESLDSIHIKVSILNENISSVLGGPSLPNLKAIETDNLNLLSRARGLPYEVEAISRSINELVACTKSMLTDTSEKRIQENPTSTPSWFKSYEAENKKAINEIKNCISSLQSRPQTGSNMYSPGPKGPASNPWGNSLRKQNEQPTNYQPAANSNKNLTVKFLIFPKNRGEELSSQCRLDIKDKAKQIRFCNQITIGKADIPLLILHQQPTLEGASKQMNIFRRDYRVEVSTSKWHPIFIHAIMAPEQMNQQESTEWLRDLISRNPHLTDLSSEFFLKIKSARFSQKSETWFASLLVHQAFYTALINGPGLYIGDGAVKWRDDIFIPKCYKCSLFGHNNLNCEKDPWCPHQMFILLQ